MEFFSITVLLLGLVGIGTWSRYLRERKLARMHDMMHQERLKAMEKGIPLAELGHEDMARELTSLCAADAQERGRNRGMVWLRIYSLGLGLIFVLGGVGALIGMRMTSVNETDEFWPLSLIPIMVGLGLLLFHHLTRGYAERNI